LRGGGRGREREAGDAAGWSAAADPRRPWQPQHSCLQRVNICAAHKADGLCSANTAGLVATARALRAACHTCLRTARLPMHQARLKRHPIGPPSDPPVAGVTG
jgi:hypothetical protein